MKIIRITGLLAACVLTTAAWGQSAGQPLNLKLPANVPAASASAAAPAAATDAKSTASASTPGSATAPASTAPSAYAKDPPGTYYGDTSGAMGNIPPSGRNVVTCDDATYNQPQIHGAVSTGVVSSNHGSGNWQSGGVTISQASGSCEHPTGGMSISVGGSTGHFGH